jgi:hypothetical protein
MNPLPVNGPSAPVPTSAKASPLLEQLRLAARARGNVQPTADLLISRVHAHRAGVTLQLFEAIFPGSGGNCPVAA